MTLNSIRKLTWLDCFLLMEALTWLAVARLVIMIFPFKFIAPFMGIMQHETPVQIPPELEKKAQRIGWAVRAAAHRTPWESACLVQSISVQRMLRSRHISGTLYLGVAKDENVSDKLKAHAWVRCGNTILTGEAGHQQFSIVSRFGWGDKVKPVPAPHRKG